MDLQKLYEAHHQQGFRQGYSIYQAERGKYFAQVIGTQKKVLDLGCRDGTLTKHYASGNEVIGVDIDNKLLRQAQKNLGIQTRHLNLYDPWPFKKGWFDAIVMGEVLEHLYKPEQVISRAATHLKSDGTLLISVPNAYIISARIRFLLGQEIPAHYDPTHINLFSASKLKRMLSNHFQQVTLDGFAPPAYKWAKPLSLSLFTDDLLATARYPKQQ